MKLGELIGLATRNGDDGGAALAERPRGQLHARRVPRARPLRREGSDALRRHRAAARRARISSCCKRTRRRCSTSRSSARRRTRWRRCCDRVRYGTIPEAVAADAMVQQAAALAANLAAQVHRWAEFRAALRPHAERRRRRRWCSGRWRSAGPRSGAPGSAAPRVAVARRGRCWRSAVVADLAVGDPVYAWHPVRLIGRTADVDGRRGCGASASTATAAACCCSSALAAVSLGVVTAIARRGAASVSPRLAWVVHAFLLYSLLALGDLLHHVWRIERAVRAGDLRARAPRGQRAGRPRHRPHGRRRLPPRGGREPQRESDRRLRQPACSGTSLAGLPGLVALQGREHDGLDGRLQDAALSALRLVRRAARRCDELPAGADHLAGRSPRSPRCLPAYSGRKAWTRRPSTARSCCSGPNSGWSEAATAGALAAADRRTDLAERRAGHRSLDRRRRPIRRSRPPET